MDRFYYSHKLEIWMPATEDTHMIDFCAIRSGNPFRAGRPSEYDKKPTNLDNLATCKLGSGHDTYLSGIFVYFDWKINKILREQLLRYNFINVISSQSLMHCFEKFKEDGWIDASIESVDDLPLSFEYWISFCCNYRQLKVIYAQRKNHKRKEWQEFCSSLKHLPNSHWITGQEIND